MNKKLSNEEILRLVEDFYNLPKGGRESKLLGSGFYKKAYELTPDLVLKEIIDPDDSPLMASEYVANKQMSKLLPGHVESPMLVTRGEGKTPVHIQQRLRNANDYNGDQKTHIKNFAQMAEDSFEDVLRSKGITPYSSDIHNQNIAFLEDKDLGIEHPKVIDVGDFSYENNNIKNSALKKARENAMLRVFNKHSSKVFRALPFIGPALGAYAALDSGDASAAIPGLDQAESIGESPEEEALMLAEDNARKEYGKSPARLNKLNALLKRK